MASQKLNGRVMLLDTLPSTHLKLTEDQIFQSGHVYMAPEDLTIEMLESVDGGCVLVGSGSASELLMILAQLLGEDISQD